MRSEACVIEMVLGALLVKEGHGMGRKEKGDRSGLSTGAISLKPVAQADGDNGIELEAERVIIGGL